MLSTVKDKNSLISGLLNFDTRNEVSNSAEIRCSSLQKAYNVADSVWNRWKQGEFWTQNTKYPIRSFIPDEELVLDSQIAFYTNLNEMLPLFCLSFNYVSHMYSSPDKSYKVIILSSDKLNIINGYYRFEIFVDVTNYIVKVKYTKNEKYNDNLIGNICKFAELLTVTTSLKDVNKDSIVNALARIENYTSNIK